MEAPQNRKILWKDGVPPVPSAHLNRVRRGGLGVLCRGIFVCYKISFFCDFFVKKLGKSVFGYKLCLIRKICFCHFCEMDQKRYLSVVPVCNMQMNRSDGKKKGGLKSPYEFQTWSNLIYKFTWSSPV